MAGKADLRKDDQDNRFPRVAEIPFSSERKRMSVIVREGQGSEGASTLQLFSKGSPELTLERCTHIQTDDRAEPLTADLRQKILAENNQLASQGLRVLGFAQKDLGNISPESIDEATEQSLTWLGLVGMLDAPRPEVRVAVAKCREAGIRPVMITGDHQLTAQAIAQDLGIAEVGAECLTGQQLQKLNQSELEDAVGRVGVYARVSPEHKLRIVAGASAQRPSGGHDRGRGQRCPCTKAG